jgi:hypothetical protein
VARRSIVPGCDSDDVQHAHRRSLVEVAAFRFYSILVPGDSLARPGCPRSSRSSAGTARSRPWAGPKEAGDTEEQVHAGINTVQQLGMRDVLAQGDVSREEDVVRISEHTVDRLGALEA